MELTDIAVSVNRASLDKSAEMTSSSGEEESNTIEDKVSYGMSFHRFPVVLSILQSGVGNRYLHQYILHYQQMDMSNHLVFWWAIHKYRSIEDKDQFATNAYLIEQRYLRPGIPKSILRIVITYSIIIYHFAHLVLYVLLSISTPPSI